MDIAVVALHLTGQPLNYQLTELGGKLKKQCFTAAQYRLYIYKEGDKVKPGLIRVPEGEIGNSYEIEVWDLPEEYIGRFLSWISQPLGLGTLNLEDGTKVLGFICEPIMLWDGEYIPDVKGWREYLEKSIS